MIDNLHQRCVQALRQRASQNAQPLSTADLEALATQLIARVPRGRLEPQLEQIARFFLQQHRRVDTLRDKAAPDHNEQWQAVIRRIRLIALGGGFGVTKDSAIDLDDLTQIVAAEVAASLAGYYFESSLDTWLHSVTLQRLKRFQRDQSAAKRSAHYAPFEQAEEVPDPMTSHEIQAIGAELRKRVEHILQREKQGQRLAQIFLLHALEDRTTEEIGKLIERHPSRVRALLKVAREVLQRELGSTEDAQDQR